MYLYTAYWNNKKLHTNIIYWLQDQKTRGTHPASFLILLINMLGAIILC